MKWAELTTTQFADINRSTPVVMNIGAIEQHGPNLPVETDSLIGRTFLEALDERASERVLILPHIAVCCSSHHMDFVGSLAVSHETLAHYIRDILNSVISHGFKNIVLFNSHGGNLAIGQVILEQLGAEHPDCNIFFFTWWHIVSKELRALQESPFGGVGHACEFETSIIANIAPHYVEGKPVPEMNIAPTFEWAESDMLNSPCGAYYRSMTELSCGDGVVGAPAFASKEKGHQIQQLVVNKLGEMVGDIFRSEDKA